MVFLCKYGAVLFSVGVVMVLLWFIVPSAIVGILSTLGFLAILLVLIGLRDVYTYTSMLIEATKQAESTMEKAIDEILAEIKLKIKDKETK